MEAKEEGMFGGMDGMMDGMMGGMMDGHTPQTLLAKIAECEQAEAALYAQIAQMIPSEELRCIIMCKAQRESCTAGMLATLSQRFGTAAPCGPTPSLYPFGKEGEEKKEEEKK